MDKMKTNSRRSNGKFNPAKLKRFLVIATLIFAALALIFCNRSLGRFVMIFISEVAGSITITLLILRIVFKNKKRQSPKHQYTYPAKIRNNKKAANSKRKNFNISIDESNNTINDDKYDEYDSNATNVQKEGKLLKYDFSRIKAGIDNIDNINFNDEGLTYQEVNKSAEKVQDNIKVTESRNVGVVKKGSMSSLQFFEGPRIIAPGWGIDSGKNKSEADIKKDKQDIIQVNSGCNFEQNQILIKGEQNNDLDANEAIEEPVCDSEVPNDEVDQLEETLNDINNIKIDTEIGLNSNQSYNQANDMYITEWMPVSESIQDHQQQFTIDDTQAKEESSLQELSAKEQQNDDESLLKDLSVANQHDDDEKLLQELSSKYRQDVVEETIPQELLQEGQQRTEEATLQEWFAEEEQDEGQNNNLEKEYEEQDELWSTDGIYSENPVFSTESIYPEYEYLSEQNNTRQETSVMQDSYVNHGNNIENILESTNDYTPEKDDSFSLVFNNIDNKENQMIEKPSILTLAEINKVNKSNEFDNATVLKEEKENANENIISDLQKSLKADNNNAVASQQDYHFPSIELLDLPLYHGQDDDIDPKTEKNAVKLIETLASFGVGASMVNISIGPTVTRYEIQPNTGVKVSKIVNLADDIALNLAARGVRLEAPIPGKAAVGIEIPNDEVRSVFLREVVESKSFYINSSKLSFAIGKSITGKPVVADIGRMPHLLIAGATGSGKSVCINTLITSILYKASPSEVKLLMIDPKVVELNIYNGIPHLLVPVVTDPKKAAAALGWAVQEMTTRYKNFAECNVRDLKGYNEHLKLNRQQPLPQIVIIIDELSDLMMVSPADVEDCVCRLAQMARAAGIHLVIATQRPSVDVITGLIKANIPSRIAFAVSSHIDSRTILDMAGAEKLLGKGDMLFYPSGESKPVRVQGAYISDKEVENIVKFIKSDCECEYDESILDHINNIPEQKQTENEEDDELLPRAVEIVLDAGQASTSLLQRKLKIGYSRAARIIDQMEEMRIVSEYGNGKPRQVLISKHEWMQMIGG